MSNPLLSIVILNNSRRDDVIPCLNSLYASKYKNFKVIIADNASTDDSVAIIRRDFPQAQVIDLASNLGYAGNNNIGIRAALEQGAEWIFLLNDDTILDPNCLSYLMETAESDPSVGILGPLVYHYDEPTVIQSAGGSLGKFWDSVHLGKDEADNGQFASVVPVQWISGCAILVRSELIRRAGMLDEDYFLYWEETEWCIRASKAGWKIVLDPRAKLWHKGVKRNYEPRPYVTYYMTRNHLFTLSKHRAPLHVRLHVFFTMLRTLVSWTIKPQWRNKRDHRDAMWKGMRDYLAGRMGPMPS